MERLQTVESGRGFSEARPPSSSRAMEGDSGEGLQREPGIGADVFAEEDAVQWDRTDDKARANPPYQEL